MYQEKDIDTLYKLIGKTGYIESFSFSREMYEYPLEGDSLTIVLCDYPYKFGKDKLKIVFYNIQDIRIYNINNIFLVLSHIVLTIEDISDRQLEAINYRVEKAEDMFSFVCEDFEYEVIYPE